MLVLEKYKYYRIRNMRKKFEIFYPSDYPEVEKQKTRYKPTGKNMLVMNNNGIFFLYNGEQFYPSIRKLSDVLPKYDVVWK